MDYYINILNDVTNKEDIKKVVKKIFYDENINDVDFNDFINNDVLKKIKKIDYTFTKKEEESFFEKILKEDY